MDRKQIIDKVIKLLALSENNTESAEAKSAKNMAAKLMAKHDINRIEDLSSVEDALSTKKHQLKRIKPAKYDAALISCISKFNGVGFYSEIGYKSNKANYVFVGKEQDIIVNEYMLGILRKQRADGWVKAREQYKEKNGVAPKQRIHTDWHMGFALGVSKKIKELTDIKNTKIEEYGLVPVDFGKQVLSSIKDLHTVNSRPASYTESGFEAGKNAHLNKGINKQSDIKLIN